MRLVRHATDGLIGEVDLIMNGLQVLLVIDDEGTMIDCSTVSMAVTAFIKTRDTFLDAGFVIANESSRPINNQ